MGSPESGGPLRGRRRDLRLARALDRGRLCPGLRRRGRAGGGAPGPDGGGGGRGGGSGEGLRSRPVGGGGGPSVGPPPPVSGRRGGGGLPRPHRRRRAGGPRGCPLGDRGRGRPGGPEHLVGGEPAGPRAGVGLVGAARGGARSLRLWPRRHHQAPASGPGGRRRHRAGHHVPEAHAAGPRWRARAPGLPHRAGPRPQHRLRRPADPAAPRPRRSLHGLQRSRRQLLRLVRRRDRRPRVHGAGSQRREGPWSPWGSSRFPRVGCCLGRGGCRMGRTRTTGSGCTHCWHAC